MEEDQNLKYISDEIGNTADPHIIRGLSAFYTFKNLPQEYKQVEDDYKRALSLNYIFTTPNYVFDGNKFHYNLFGEGVIKAYMERVINSYDPLFIKFPLIIKEQYKKSEYQLKEESNDRNQEYLDGIINDTQRQIESQRLFLTGIRTVVKPYNQPPPT